MASILELVWNLDPELRTYEGIFEHFQKIGEYQITLKSKNNGEEYLYGYNFAIGMLTISTKDHSKFQVVCPHGICQLPSGNGFMCSHLRCEIAERTKVKKESVKAVGIFRDCSISVDSIKYVIEAITKARKLEPPHLGQDQHNMLIKSIRAFPFIVKELDLIVSCDAHSKSMDLCPLSGGFGFTTCARAGCYKPGCINTGSNSYCSNHFDEAIKKGELEVRQFMPTERALVYRAVYVEATGESDPMHLDIEIMKTVYKYLWRLGVTGFYFEKGCLKVTIWMTECRSIRMASHNTKAVQKIAYSYCSVPCCIARASSKHLTRREKSRKLTEKLILDRCKDHKDSKDNTIISATQGIAYGELESPGVLSKESTLDYK